MKDKYLGMVCMTLIAGMCILFKTTYASEIVTGLSIALAAVIRD